MTSNAATRHTSNPHDAPTTGGSRADAEPAGRSLQQPASDGAHAGGHGGESSQQAAIASGSGAGAVVGALMASIRSPVSTATAGLVSDSSDIDNGVPAGSARSPAGQSSERRHHRPRKHEQQGKEQHGKEQQQEQQQRQQQQQQQHPRQQHHRPRGRVYQGRCVGATGGWCGGYQSQSLVDFRAPPIMSKPCASGCSGVGNCRGDTGTCDCPAGWGGPRCAGICDDDIGACYCDPKLGNPKYGRIPAPEGSPPGTLPVQEGRPLFDPCSRLADDGKGNKLNWHHITVPYDKVYGPEGWCVLNAPKIPVCGCGLDGYGGAGCGLRSEMVCPNQCSGRGACRRGFCACDAGC
ncbi:exostosin-like glycosyltransferase [Monoraphidium neglectum]|uniref:Exostosin-like glycosyltransferase n=1 Tax=Monoraphidium neglectum TaxID=145388 RepID=A0A0D2MSR2_9CHLO|nr:exostosin-like glycosyltransferase [Monoraphidium neglectum]KIY97550.1 exostosin-like glycosyltransferase [Monoraphidium neglectum]|eukprot:XP_013896570.1 exostosin-like glycosyltransferase [Monoraphidium neglectum]